MALHVALPEHMPWDVAELGHPPANWPPLLRLLVFPTNLALWGLGYLVLPGHRRRWGRAMAWAVAALVLFVLAQAALALFAG